MLIILIMIFASLWWLLTAGATSAWMLGVPAVAAAVWASKHLLGRTRISLSLLGLLRFIPYFLVESLRGGLDVALRTLSPRLNIQPAFFQYYTTIELPLARIFFCNCVSLLPGTLCVELQDNCIEIHLLNQQTDISKELKRLERIVLQLFSLNEGTR